MKVHFYLPEAHLPSAENRSAWLEGRVVRLEQEGKVATTQSWIYRTWIALEKSGSPVELVHEFPEEGAVIALSGALAPDWIKPENLFVAAVVADGLPHPAADLHIVQNASHAQRLPGAIFQPHWPQPGLRARDEARGGQFNRAAFFGTRSNLAAEMQNPAWAAELMREAECAFELREADKWHDYSDIDAVVAVRDFAGGQQLHKPATKLYNAWLAGVPFIGGSDSAYAAEGSPGRDYLVARNASEVLSHLRRLRNEPKFRASLVAQGKAKSGGYTAEAITARWRKLIEQIIPEKARRRSENPRWLNRCQELAMRGVCAADRIFRT
jgi:hypothetical protein